MPDVHIERENALWRILSFYVCCNNLLAPQVGTVSNYSVHIQVGGLLGRDKCPYVHFLSVGMYLPDELCGQCAVVEVE